MIDPRRLFEERLRPLLREAGEAALSLQDRCRPRLKPDRSVVTDADMVVSRILREGFSDVLREDGHLWIDEEDPRKPDPWPEMGARRRYLWTVDPIDGTRAYANRLPLYGISLGVLKEMRPWLGAVYLPALQELFWCDGTETVLVQGAFSPAERRTPIVPVKRGIDARSIFYATDLFLRCYEWDPGLCQLALPACAVMDLCWPASGRGCGAFFNAHLWDFAGSWPIFRAAGMDLREIETGDVFDRLRPEVFQHGTGRPWRLRGHFLLSSEEDFLSIRRAITTKDGRRFPE